MLIATDARAERSQVEARKKCDTCGRDDFEVGVLYVCPCCRGLVDAKLAMMKLRISGQVDWEDVKKYGIYDRFGVPIATVLSVESQPYFGNSRRSNPNVSAQGLSTWSTGPMPNVAPHEHVKVLKIKELK